jgi:hypothetical protein
MDVYTARFDEQLEAIKQADEKEPKMQPTTKIRIILLEDTEAIRDSLAKMLTIRGY